ncbi:DUF6461 domain-containing protein [Streptomyces sp. NPDC055144]
MNLVTAHDYAWIRTSPLFRHMLESAYTLTLIRGRTPREVLRAMEAEPRGTGEGTAGLLCHQGSPVQPFAARPARLIGGIEEVSLPSLWRCPG